MLKEFGPVHAYAVPVPAVKLKVEPTQVVAPVTVTIGSGFMATTTAAVFVQPEAFVTVTIYIPPFTTCAFGIVGFCALLANTFGPVHV